MTVLDHAALTFPDGAIAVVSFDIDGTMRFGNPPGPIDVAVARRLAELGHVIGSASDRTRSDQSALWDEHGLEVSFVGGKHHLHEVRSRFTADHYVHIGDTDVDEHYARLAGFDFVSVTEFLG
ncbi:MAG TPA: HAD family hydrolase [Acidimicrobiia bacterium]|nr:HAD family hydrolase [Acidimicrobiia bacterium]